jgi:T-complex protein 1 subunit gamma
LLQAVADIIRTTLGPQSMLKMLLDASGGVHTPQLRCLEPNTLTLSARRAPGIVLTNDGNAILREIDVSHPAAKARV